MARILPFLASSDQRAARALVAHFLPLLRFSSPAPSEPVSVSSSLWQDMLVKVMNSIPPTPSGAALQVLKRLSLVWL